MNINKLKYPLILGGVVIGVLLLQSCSKVGIPQGANAVKNFNADKYLGTWYEVARFDFSQEKNLSNVTATYSQNSDGSIKVVNRGYNFVKNKWTEAKGKAKFVNDPTEGRLKVSFFGPFYAGYNVVMMEPDYENALIMGSDKDYIWFLSRSKTMPESIKNKFVQKAKEVGYNLDKLIWTKHDK